MKILLVDDEIFVRKVLTDFFQRKGHQVAAVDSGMAALKLARNLRPDLIISDIMMPDMDGFQFRRAVLEDEFLRTLPFIFYSGKFGDEKSMRLAGELGVSLFINKPVSNEEFCTILEKVLEEQGGTAIPTALQEKTGRFDTAYQEVLRDRLVRTNRELEEAHKAQQIINNLLHLTLADLSFQELLDALLEQIISFPWYGLLPKGAIFIVQGNELVLKAYRGMPDVLLELCNRVSFGFCLCGRCAESGEIVFADQVDERHDIHYQGIQPHGHYCVPIKTGAGRLLGVLTLYIEPGSSRRKEVVESLENAAKTAAAIIMRKLNEIELESHFKNLHKLNKVTSQLIFRRTGSDPLLLQVCRLAREYFQLKMVWVGLLGEEHHITIAAADGEGLDYLEDLKIRCLEGCEDKGPVCTGIRTGKPVPCNDIESDSLMIQWRQKALACGFHSLLALPLIDPEKKICLGTLNMYAAEKGFFTPERIDLYAAYVNNVVAVMNNEQLLAELEQKIHERTAELVEAKNLAEAADRAKSSFLANMSHELRTPLNSIIGFADIMRQGISGDLLPEQKEYCNDILESGRHLLELVNDILDLSKIEAGMMELQYDWADIGDLLARCLFMVREKAMKHGIDIITEIQPNLPEIEVDERRIRQVLVNLLSNGVKFTPDGGKVSIAVKMLPDEAEDLDEVGGKNDFILLTVADTGPGIAAEDQDKLFKPFVQLDTTISREVEGSGLGLVLSKRIVEQHHGSIFVVSDKGQGSVFCVILPVRRTAEERKLPVAFLPWTIFLRHTKRIISMGGRVRVPPVLLRLDCEESPANIDWRDIVVSLTGHIRFHEYFSRDPVEGAFYFLLLCNETNDIQAAVSRLTELIAKTGVSPVFHQAKFPDDGATTTELLRFLGAYSIGEEE